MSQDQPNDLDESFKKLQSDLSGIFGGKPRRTTCFLFFHDWSKWEDVEKGSLGMFNKTIGSYTRQERRCGRCNKLEMKRVDA